MIDLVLLLATLAVLGYSAVKLWAPGGSEPDAEDEAEAVPGPVKRLLLQLHLPLEPPVFIAGLVLLGLGLIMLMTEVAGIELKLAAAGSLALLFMLILLLRDLADRRGRHFESRLLDAMDLMSAALQGGLPARQALQAAALGARGAVKEELQEIVQRLELGLSMEQAVHRIGLRYDTEGVRLFRQALIAKWHSGGDFATLIRAVNGLIRDRIKLRAKVEGQLSGARYAALFSGGLPYLLVPLFLWRQPEWFEALFSHPRGPSLLVGAALLQLAGFFWLRRILRVAL